VGNSSRRPVVKVDGINELKRTMKRAGVELQDLKDAHAAVAQTVIDSARPWVPVRSGALAGSLRGSGQAGAAVVRAGRAAVPYANPIHWGWPSRGIKARPFMWTAIHKSQDQWTGQYLTALQKIIDDIEGAPGP
jgi:hypothetical protein